MSVTRENIVAAARARLGVAWQHQGRSEAGIDCVGLVTKTAADLGLSDFDLDNYARMPNGIELLDILRSQMPQIHPAERFGLGDVLVFRSQGTPTHVGIAGDYRHGGFSLIHAYNDASPPRVVEHRLDGTLWLPRLVAAFSLIEAKR